MAEQRNHIQEQEQSAHGQRYKWLLVTALALSIHGFAALLMYLLVRFERGVIYQEEVVRVDLLERKPEPSAPKAIPLEPIDEKPTQKKRRPRRMKPGISDEIASDSKVLEDLLDTDIPEPDVLPEPPSVEKLPRLDHPSSARILAKIASEDARIRRMLDQPEEGPFAEKRGPSKFNLPAELKHDEIRRLIENHWNPDWSEIHDDGIAKVSGKWAGEGLKNWFLSYQERVKEYGSPDRITPENVEEIIAVQDNTYTSNKLSVEIDLEPLHDGTYAISISKSSGHPFFDRAALAKIKEISTHFPPWEEGYGYILRYKLDATFTIVPPSPSTLIGLSCAFPFCTPDELKELEVIHWFKKMVNKNVYFQGIIAPPPLAD